MHGTTRLLAIDHALTCSRTLQCVCNGRTLLATDTDQTIDPNESVNLHASWDNPIERKKVGSVEILAKAA